MSAKKTHANPTIINETRMMFIKHYAPNRCLCIKVANSIDHWVEDCRDVTKGEGGGGYVQRMEFIVKRKKVRGDHGRCERRSEAFVEIQKKKNLGGGGGRRVGGQGGCEQRSKVFQMTGGGLYNIRKN